MADETSSAMNLDLNLGPLEHGADATEPGSGSYSNSAFELIGGNGLQPGEGSVTAEERNNELAKTLENGNGYLEDVALRKKEDREKNNGVEGSFFDCNICLDLAKDPVVTCCGHLFCWPCLYRWLHHHSDAKECPVCKGEVTTTNVTPIYGSGSSIREHGVDSRLDNIPLRPQASRVEGLRQIIQRNVSIIPMENWHLPSTVESSQASVQNQSRRYSSLLDRYLNHRGMLNGRRAVPQSVAVADLGAESSLANNELWSSRLSLYLRNGSNSNRNQEQAPRVDDRDRDRDSLSSIAAVINSESQTADNAAFEIDSRVLHSTPSSRTRRRNETPRTTTDVDGGESRPRRSRRLN